MLIAKSSHDVRLSTSCDALQVGAHHVGNTADFGEAPDFIHRCLAAGPRVLQGFPRYVRTDLVVVLEAVVGHRLGHARGAQRHAIVKMLLNSAGVDLFGHLHHLKARQDDAWHVDRAQIVGAQQPFLSSTNGEEVSFCRKIEPSACLVSHGR